jgi:hypothetical protein
MACAEKQSLAKATNAQFRNALWLPSRPVATNTTLFVGMAAVASASADPGPDSSTGDLPPNQTLYVNNLNDKIKRADLKKTLYTSFSQFGRVMQIICKGSFKLKGQAWITFDDVSSAVTAKRQLTNCPIFGKPLVSAMTAPGMTMLESIL